MVGARDIENGIHELWDKSIIRSRKKLKQNRIIHPSLLRRNTVLQCEGDERSNVTCLRLLVPQGIQDQ